MDKFIAFLRDVKVELSRVSWPTRQQTINYTLIVVGASLVVAVFLGSVDSLFAFLLNKVIK